MLQSGTDDDANCIGVMQVQITFCITGFHNCSVKGKEKEKKLTFSKVTSQRPLR